jgi:hypothetical protein
MELSSSADEMQPSSCPWLEAHDGLHGKRGGHMTSNEEDFQDNECMECGDPISADETFCSFCGAESHFDNDADEEEYAWFLIDTTNDGYE